MIDGLQEVLDDVMIGMGILFQHAMEAKDIARATRRVEGHAKTTCYVFGGLLLIMMWMFLVRIAIRIWF